MLRAIEERHFEKKICHANLSTGRKDQLKVRWLLKMPNINLAQKFLRCNRLFNSPSGQR